MKMGYAESLIKVEDRKRESADGLFCFSPDTYSHIPILEKGEGAFSLNGGSFLLNLNP